MASALQRLFRKRAKARQQEAQKKEANARHSDALEDAFSSSPGGGLNRPSPADRSSSPASSLYSAPLTPHSTRTASTDFVHHKSHVPLSPALTVSSLASLRSPDSSSTQAMTAPFSGWLSGPSRPRAHSFDALSSFSGQSGLSKQPGSIHDEFGRMSLQESRADETMYSFTHASDNEEEDDFDVNPVYTALSETPVHQQDWRAARLVLLPPASLLREMSVPVDSEPAWTALHALKPSPVYRGQYVNVRSSDQTSQRTTRKRPVEDLDRRDAKDETSSAQEAPNVHFPTLSSARSEWDECQLTATLEEDRRVSVCLHRPDRPAIQCVARVVSEVSVYRTQAVSEGPDEKRAGASSPGAPTSPHGFEVLSRPVQPCAAKLKGKQEKIRVRVLLLDGLIAPRYLDACDAGEAAASPIVDETMQDASSSAPMSRAPSSAASIVFPSAEPQSPTDLSRAPSMGRSVSMRSASTLLQERIQAVLPEQPNLACDLLVLKNPPMDLPETLRNALSTAFAEIQRNADSFRSAYVLVRGFEQYDATRIRRGVVLPAVRLLDGPTASLGSALRHRLALACENVAFGTLHSRLYPAVRATQRVEDEALDALLHTYAKSGKPAAVSLGVTVSSLRTRPARLDPAVRILESIGTANEEADRLMRLDASTLQSLAQGSSQREGDWSGCTQSSQRVRTPLDILATLVSILKAIGDSVTTAARTSSHSSLGSMLDSHESRPLGADELLPIVATVIVRARPAAFGSALLYARTFGIDNSTNAETSWALTTFEAVLEWLRADPLRLKSGPRGPNEVGPAPPTSLDGQKIGMSLSRRAGASDAEVPQLDDLARSRRTSLPSDVLLMARSNSAMMRSTSSFSERDTASRPTSPEDEPTGNDGFKMPGRPASATFSQSLSRHHSRVKRPQSVLGVLGEDTAFAGCGAHDSAEPDSHLAPSDSAPIPSHPNLHIRPQIVTRRRPTASAASTSSGRAERASALERSAVIGASFSDMPVRVVGSEASLSSPTSSGMTRGGSEDLTAMANHGHVRPDGGRRKSMDSWSALSMFYRAPSEERSRPESAAQHAEDQIRKASVRSFSPAASSVSEEGDVWKAPPSQSGTWLPTWSDFSTSGRKRASFSAGTLGATMQSTSPPASAVSTDGISPSGTFSTLPRSNSGSGFAALCGESPRSISSARFTDTATAATGPVVPTLQAWPHRYSAIKRTASSISAQTQVVPDQSTASICDSGSEASSLKSTRGSQDVRAFETSALERRRRLSRLMSPSLSASASPAMQPSLAVDFSASGDFTPARPSAEERMPVSNTHAPAPEFAAFRAALAASFGSRSPPSSSSSAQGETVDRHSRRRVSFSDSTTPGSSGRLHAAIASDASSSHSQRDSYFPQLRIHVPSPVQELADPISSATISNGAHSGESLSPPAATSRGSRQTEAVRQGADHTQLATPVLPAPRALSASR
ncbi:hypothetical protein IE81DRAFT_368753 [Ceraceosorus guamensis]|uniref:VPS9 domain-containing protein n=1 Tax=Ceraceosorus guamensis TaxID=1522189 RepID=A0A316VRL1_9BASI|nr:hypothetical protein IE81DRAFT_368753 [Ceraceosorus guamensis]PWN39854.1 hypothetical protein IE81DRAFT_368753 [Ceraceosorus guamensis]